MRKLVLECLCVLMLILVMLGKPADAGYHHALVAKSGGGGVASSIGRPIARALGLGSTTGTGLVAGGMIVLVGYMVYNEVTGPACASNSKYNKAHGYDYPMFWRPLCNWKDPAKRKPVSVRG